jgi:hypothetical protein
MEKSAVKPRFSEYGKKCGEAALFKTEHLFCFATKVLGGGGRTS